MVSLLDMPDVPMNSILDHGGPSVIFSLRKVCKNLRDYIDETMPELHPNAINICLEYKKITITWSHYLENVQIGYKLHGNGYKAVFGEKENFVENVDYMKGFWNDYSLIMKYQKSSLKRFHLHLSNSTDVEDISKFLEQYQNSQTIKTHASYYDKNIDFTEIVQLDQWKNAQKFSSRNLSIAASMKHFAHFSKINAEFQRIFLEPENLNVLKEAAIRSPNFEKYIIEYHYSFNVRQTLSEVFGNPFTYSIGQNKWSWFFNTCREEKILQINNFLMFDRINFSLINRSMVPNGAEIKNIL
ncbi:unnamed protein product [Caenorhabditis nigoni]